MTNGYRYGAESWTIVPIIFVRLQFVPLIVVLTVMEASPARAVNAAGTKLSNRSMGLSVELLAADPPRVWYKLFRIEATVEVASDVVVVDAPVEEDVENVDRIEESVDVVSLLSAESKESLTIPGSFCNLAIIDASEEVACARVSGVESTKSPIVLLTMRFKMLESGASTFVPSPTFKFELIGSH